MPHPLRFCLFVLSLLIVARAHAADAVPAPVVYLWANGAPGFEKLKDEPEIPVKWGISHINNPSLTVFLPAAGTATGAGVVILPGGGHRFLNIASEGTALGAWLAQRGIAAFVVKYRLAKDQTMEHSPYRIDVEEMQDTRRALRVVRFRALEWGINPARLGIIGFSAGGRLAARACMAPDAGNPAAPDPVDRVAAKANFQVLVYPGEPDEIVPTKDSPPAFLVAGFDDDLSDGLIRTSLKFKHAGVPVELHVYAGIGHAFNFRVDDTRPVGGWGDRMVDWIRYEGFAPPPPKA